MQQQNLPPVDLPGLAEIPVAAQRLDARIDIGRHMLTNELIHAVAIVQFVDGDSNIPSLRVTSSYLPNVARQIAQTILELCDSLDAAASTSVVEQQTSEVEPLKTEGNA